MELPQKELLDVCCKLAEEKAHDLKELQKIKEFMNQVETMADKYIDEIEFRFLRSENEEIDEILERSDSEEEEKNEESDFGRKKMMN